jgi:uncharacterized protein (DUF983 family)
MLLLNRGALLTKDALGLQSCSASRRIVLHRGFAPKIRCKSSSAQNTRYDRDNVPATWSLLFAGVLGVSVVTWTAWKEYQPFRHSVLAAVRCSRVAGEVTVLMLHFIPSLSNKILQVLLYLVRLTIRLRSQNRMNQTRCVWKRTPNATSAVQRGC